MDDLRIAVQILGPRLSAADVKSLVNKAVGEADDAVEDAVRYSDDVQKAVSDFAGEVEGEYEEGDNLRAALDKVGSGVKKKAKRAVLNAVIDGILGAGERVTGVKAGRVKQLIRVFVKRALPMAVFGFIDNIILVLVGEMIDRTIAMQLGIGTMAAAGLGNATSDAVGVLGQDSVDRVMDKVGLGPSEGEDEQTEGRLEKFVGLAGGVIGIVVGCLIGMIPLAFMKTASRVSSQEEDEYLNRNFILH